MDPWIMELVEGIKKGLSTLPRMPWFIACYEGSQVLREYHIERSHLPTECNCP